MEIYNLRALYSTLDTENTNAVPRGALLDLPAISNGQIETESARALLQLFEARGEETVSYNSFVVAFQCVQSTKNVRNLLYLVIRVLKMLIFGVF